jgi:putative intracellular protease/amidase
MTNPRILMVLTSHDALGNTGEKTGFWLEEFAAPYFVFKDAGANITLASPKGGQPPVDPKSAMADSQTDATRRFEASAEDLAFLANTRKLSEIDAGDYDALFFPGGHGPMWDLASDQAVADLIEAFDAEGKVISAVCHGPAALVNAKSADGAPLVAGRNVTGFTNSEEAAVGLTDIVPFLLQDRLDILGGKLDLAADFTAHIVTDGNLVTGQNPASSEPAANAVLHLLNQGR